jgi:putative membrane protein
MIITHNIRVGRIISGTGRNMLYSAIVCTLAYFINDLLLKKHFEFPVLLISLIGTALSFFIGFTSNQAYARWWEARQIWGTLVNGSRTWARSVLSYLAPGAAETFPTITDQLIHRHIAFLYALKSNLRKSNDETFTLFLKEQELDEVKLHANIPNAILSLQTRDLERLYQSGYIDGYKFLEFNKVITSFCDEMGKSERIKNTVFPTTYSYYTRIFIWYLIVTSTAALSPLVGLWAILFGSLLGYVFLTIHVIGQALVNPFDPIPTGIPLDHITRTIEINLLQMNGERNIPPPIDSVNGEYLM